jgi:outer membrane protein assembly factor BamE
MAEPMRQHPTRRLLAAVALAGALTLTSGCLYRMKIEQGNFLDPGQVMQLKEGMTKSQVRFLLGTPMVPHGFNSDRWNYYSYEKSGNAKSPATMRLTVWFKDDKVERYERPANTEAIAAAIDADNEKAAAAAAAASARAEATPLTPVQQKAK